MKRIKENKILLVLGAFLLVILVLGVIFYSSRRKSKKVIPRADYQKKSKVLKDVKIKVSSAKGKKSTILLSIENIPQGTESIDYELTYETEDKGLQGVIGTIDDLKGSSYEKEIFLGTCSSGVCIEHKVKGSINLVLRFSGDYGEEVFEKTYEI